VELGPVGIFLFYFSSSVCLIDWDNDFDFTLFKYPRNPRSGGNQERELKLCSGTRS
jgi:hypothetical protein